MKSEADPAPGSILSALLPPLGPLLVWPRAYEDGPLAAGYFDVRASVLWDPTEPVPSVPGGILLMPGASMMKEVASTAIQQAVAQGYVAVVMKARDVERVVPTMSSASTLLILSASDDASWASIHTLISDAIRNGSNIDEGSFASVAQGDLSNLANAIASMAGTAVTIENENREVVAYSNIPGQDTDDSRRDAILGRAVPDSPWYLARYRAVAMATEPVHFGPENGALARIAMPVRVGPRLIGSLWAFDAGGVRSQEISKLLAEAAPVVSLHLANSANAFSWQRFRRGELLTSALNGEEIEADVDMTLRAQMPVMLVGFSHSSDETQVDLGRVADIIALNAEAIRRTASCAVVRSRIFVLLPHSDRLTKQQIEQFLAVSCRAVAGAAKTNLRTAYSHDLLTPSDLLDARADIESAFRYLSTHAKGGPISTWDDRHLLVLQELSEKMMGADGRLLPAIRAILDHDATHRTEYAATLLSYLNAFGDYRQAADANMIHENSQRYRMRQLTKIFDIDLDDPALRLIVWLQLYLRSSGGPK